MAFELGQLLWRLEDKSTANGYFNVHGDWEWSGSYSAHCKWQVYTVEKVTPKGAWIAQGLSTDTIRGFRRWVGNTTRFVQATKREAWEAAVFRRSYHIKKSKQRLEQLEMRLRAIEREEPHGD